MKYPLMFKESTALIINKTDLMPYVNFDMEKAVKDAMSINPDLNIFKVSCKTGEGLDKWVSWMTSQIERFKG
jgi:hydrogenase nickel incorporation protein HypB